MEVNSIDAGSRFLASTLHEVRTPIQTIISTVELLGETSLDKEQNEYVHQIEFSANVLLQLANDILDYTKIHSGDFKLEYIPFDVVELTEHVVDLVSIEAINKGLEIVTDIDHTFPKIIMGDPTRLQQVILNLVKNAVKFTEKGYVVVRVYCRDEKLYFEIIDSGIGIPKEKQELVFNNFYQVDASTTRKYGGSGMGLAICKNLVDIMKGQIGVKDNPAGGSIFWFSIPMQVSQIDAQLEEFTPHLTIPEHTKILLVDDNELALAALATKIKNLGISQIDTALSGEQALEKISAAAKEKHPYTVVFVDMIMPKMDGWRFASEVTSSLITNKLKMYLVVPEGQMGKDAKMKILDWFNGYLYKPVKRKQLFTLLNEAFTSLPNIYPVEMEAIKNINLAPTNLVPLIEENEIARNCKVLVAEDHPVNRKLIETFLRKFGATVYSAEDGAAAVKMIEKHPETDLIFMDILMPVKSGIDATVELRAKNYNGIIIACTANNDPNDFKTYRELGINDILVKPFKKDGVRGMLEKWTAVLTIPEAKEIVSLTEVNNLASDKWDISDFMDTVGGDEELAVSLMNDFIKQTEEILAELRPELKNPEKDFKKLDELSHKLKGSCGTLSISSLYAPAKKMNEAARKDDFVTVEASEVEFELAFIEFKNLEKKWSDSLK
ncbi:MAG: response regulator [Treponema sp.]|nr:response regulator [Treponema sp.]